MKILNWKTWIGPGVIGSHDWFGFCRHQWLRPDTPARSSDDVFTGMAKCADGFRLDHQAKTGEEIASVTTYVTLWTANRGLHVTTAMAFIEAAEPGRFNVIHPAIERCRWQHLDRAMKAFLN